MKSGWFSTGRLLPVLPLLACQAAPGQVVTAEPAAPMSADSAAPASDSLADSGVATDSVVVNAAPDARDASLASETGVSPGLFLRFPDPVASLLHGDEQRSSLCASGHDDAVSDVFCGGSAPRITSLAELFALLDIVPSEHGGLRAFALTGHSTALSKRSVSAINPRVIFVHLESASIPPLAVAFARGETLVEIVTRSRTLHELQFYAVSFKLHCSDTALDCSPGELLTSATERDWQSVDLYHEDDLKNTAFDCRACHQPAGPGTPKLLRMQELETPWTHWFDEQTQGGRALLADYYALHGNEPLAGIPSSLIMEARGGLMSALVHFAGSDLQPNEFASKQIEGEVEQSAPEQPADNQTRGRSETWRALYQAAQRAEAIPPPYHDVKITDPTKLANVTRGYSEYRAGRLPQHALPDIRDVLPDDDTALAEMGFALDERLEDRALLTAACGLCHNARLDQSLSRARFHTDLERLSPQEKQTAIERLNLPAQDPLAMPPRRTHALSDAARARLVTVLRR